MSANINAIHILEENTDKIDWNFLSLNFNIFSIDYNFLKIRMDLIREELMMKIFHPSRFLKQLHSGYDIADDSFILQ
jgi:hypothetical protein